METAPIADESTPLLRNSSTSSEHKPLFTFIDRIPLDENGITSSEQMPLDGSCDISNGETLPYEEGTSNSDTRPMIDSCPRTFELETNEVSLEDVAQAMRAAFQRYYKETPCHIPAKLDFFTTKQLYAMHLAWKNITSGRHCSFQPHIIAEAVANEITKVLLPLSSSREISEFDPECYFYIEFTRAKSLLTVDLLREWERISEGVGFPSRYVETIFEDSDERPPAVYGSRLRQVELYDKIQEFFRCSKWKSLISLLIIWPISLLIIGSKYTECPSSHLLPYMLIILGYVGCLAILARLSLMYLELRTQNACELFWEWIGLRLIEFTFFIAFVVQTFYFFGGDPTTEPDPNQCMKSFYFDLLVVNYVSIALVSAYVFAYSVLICKNLFDFWHFIFRYL